MKYTKGPWQIIDDATHIEVVADMSYNPICTGLGLSKDQANLTLISKSPELLDACKRILNIIQHYETSTETHELIEDIQKLISEIEE